jgi:hypothetical protein
MAERMSLETAGQLVRALLGAVCLLDHAVADAVREGVTPNGLSTLRRTAGEVMGLMYSYLGPCFAVAPELDPGRGGKPLDGPVPKGSGSRESFLRLLDAVDDAIRLTQPSYDAAVSDAQRDWLTQMRQELREATTTGRKAIARLAD